MKSLSRVRLFATPWTVAHQALPSMGFSRQEYWSGLPFPSLGDLPNPGIEALSLASLAFAGRFFDHCVTWEAYDSELKATEEMDTQCQASSTNKRQLGDTWDLPLGGPHRVLLSYRDAEQKILSLSTDIPDV